MKTLREEDSTSKVNLIKKAAGGDISITKKALEEDFDPEKYDKLVEGAFGDDYYQENEAEVPPPDQEIINILESSDKNPEEDSEQEQIWWFCDSK